LSISASFPIALFIWSGIANRWQKLFLQIPNCNGDNFQKILDDFSLQESKELIVIVLDNGAFHKAKSLKIPENIILIFLPPYSPELNPAEKIWAKFKSCFINRLYKTLDDLDEYLYKLSASITQIEIKSICSFNYIFEDYFWTNI
jgi:transposase